MNSRLDSYSYTARNRSSFPDEELYKQLTNNHYSAIDCSVSVIQSGIRLYATVDRHEKKTREITASDGNRVYNFYPHNASGSLRSSKNRNGDWETIDSLLGSLTVERLRMPFLLREFVEHPDRVDALIEQDDNSTLTIRLLPLANRGLECRVVLDKSKGYAPREFSMLNSSGDLLSNYSVSAYREVHFEDGLAAWVPSAGRWARYEFKGQLFETPIEITQFELLDWRTGGEYEDDIFTIEFPNGTTVQDDVIGYQYIKGGQDLILQTAGLLSSEVTSMLETTEDPVGAVDGRDEKAATQSKPEDTPVTGLGDRSVATVVIVTGLGFFLLGAGTVAIRAYRARDSKKPI